MRLWESVLRRDSRAWEDYKAWLKEYADNELEGVMHASPGEGLAFQKGKVTGIRAVMLAATANEREEAQRARTSG